MNERFRKTFSREGGFVLFSARQDVLKTQEIPESEVILRRQSHTRIPGDRSGLANHPLRIKTL